MYRACGGHFDVKMVYLAAFSNLCCRRGGHIRFIATTINRSTSVAATRVQRRRESTNAVARAYVLSPEFPPLYVAQQCLEAVHSWTHLPWWAVILGTTIVLRSAVTLPIAVHQIKLVAKIELLQPTVKMMSESLKHRVTTDCRRAGISAEEAEKRFKKKHRTMLYDLYQSEGCNPLKMYLLPWCQLPVWFILSLTLRNMSGYLQAGTVAASESVPQCIGLGSEGALWFTDLTVTDPTLILPCAVGLFNLANIELNAMRVRKATRFQRTVTNSMRVLSVFMILVASQVPALLSFFWGLSACFGLLQNVAFKFPKVRRQLNVPKTPSESKRPFQELKKIATVKMELFIKHQHKPSRMQDKK